MVEQFTYTADWNQVKTYTDPLTHVTTFGYDERGQLTSITNHLGHFTQITYNGSGQPLTITDPLSHTTTFTYDQGVLRSVRDHLNRTTTYWSDKEPIYVHKNDADPFPSSPHGHIGGPNSSTKVDVNTGDIYNGTKNTGKKLTKKQLTVLQKALKQAGLLGTCLILPLMIDDILRGGDGLGSMPDPIDYLDPFGPFKGNLSDDDMIPLSR